MLLDNSNLCCLASRFCLWFQKQIQKSYLEALSHVLGNPGCTLLKLQYSCDGILKKLIMNTISTRCFVIVQCSNHTIFDHRHLFCHILPLTLNMVAEICYYCLPLSRIHLHYCFVTYIGKSLSSMIRHYVLYWLSAYLNHVLICLFFISTIVPVCYKV